jgi:hypothetical protein
MNLTDNNTGPVTNYQSLFRPQPDPQAIKRQSSSATKQLPAKASNSTKSQTHTNGNQKAHTSKHAATRDNSSHYFPGTKQ